MESSKALPVVAADNVVAAVSASPTRTRARRLSHFYPKSFLMLILAGFSLAVLPLILALVNNAISIHELATKSQRAVFTAVQATQNSRLLLEHLTDMERTARHFSIVATPELFSAFQDSHQDFADTVKSMMASPLSHEQLRALNELARTESKIYDDVIALHDDPKQLSSVVDSYQALGALARSLDSIDASIVNREVAAMRELAGDVRDFIYWQLVALVPVALFVAVGVTILILKPIRQMEAALGRIGEGDFTHPVSVSGPNDLEALGRQLDWVRLRLIDLEEQKTRFMRQLSHELKTPLSAIREGAELLEDGSVGALSRDQLEVCRILRQNALRLQRLIEDLLNYHTVQFQKSGLNIKPVDLATVLRKAAEAHRLPVRAKDLRLTLDCPSIQLEADDNKLEVILDNLLSNAVKFSPPMGEVAVHARVLADEVCIEVSDEGPGIAPQERDRVFDAFYQGSAQPRGPVKGTGLGLAIVREYVLAHGGRIEILDDRPAGAHFRIGLPVTQATLA